ncbi:RNI-like protein [Hortaea werneckii]|nr:RNI-like protein [Hortaea werneckii]
MRRQQFRASQTAIRSSSASSDPLALLSSYDASLNPSRPVKSSPLGSSTIAGLPLELLDRLRAFPLFQSAPESFVLDIGKSLRPTVYQPAHEIIREGDDAKAMYWLVRGSVRVTSRDGESTYTELKPGAFFGEIGILMDMPRTASIVASIRSLVVRLNKEDLQKELPRYPDVERAIREEALERLAILERKKKEKIGPSSANDSPARPPIAPRKRSRDWIAGEVEMGEAGSLVDGEILANKRRKSPSPGITDIVASSALGEKHADLPYTVRQLLKELPLFSGLPNEILHFLGVNAQPVSFAPFTDILKQDSMGRDVFFITKGEVEVLTEVPDSRRSSAQTAQRLSPPDDSHLRQRVRARLKTGQYFGEVTSLSLAPRRTATVRSVDAVECLLISGEVLDDLWVRCGPDLKHQVESEARRRLSVAKRDDDVVMADVGLEGGAVGGGGASTEPVQRDGEDDDWRKGLPTVKFEEPPFDDHPTPIQQMEPADPDPFFNPDLDNMRAKSRRSSLAPPLPSQDGSQPSHAAEHRTPSPPGTLRPSVSSPLRPGSMFASPASGSPSSLHKLSPTSTRRPSIDRRPSQTAKGRLPDPILVLVLQHLDLLQLMQCRLVSTHWWNLINTSPDVLKTLDLASYNRHVTDDALRNVLIPFAGSRPQNIDLSNCFHISDEGFRALAEACGEGATVWKMKSVWDVSGPAILSLVEKAKSLEEIDLSNCRKVGDNLLARIVGWIVPDKPGISQPPPVPSQNGKRQQLKRGHSQVQQQNEQPPSAPGTVIGANRLKRLTLSYCKHIQDRSMAHIAVHAADRIETLDLTRCTSISDAGFHQWSVYDFKNLKKLVLADCTYLSDQAIVGIVGGCRNLRELDLSFCCALSDTATEVLALGLPLLQSLNMAFCGSAVSDNSLRCIGLHLLELRHLSVRGCVRVTGQGVEAVVEGCKYLQEFDVSQCKNLRRWLEADGVAKVRNAGRRVKFDTVADGMWRVGGR